MAILSKGHTFANGDQVTTTKLNNLVDNATFSSGAVDNSTITLHASGYVQVGVIQTGNIAANSITTAKLADSTGASDGVTTAKLATGAVTTAKIADISVTIPKIATGAFATQSSMASQTASLIVTPDVVKYSPPTAKAYGTFTIASTPRTLSGAFNVSVTRISSTATQVTFTSAMSSAAYSVVCTYGRSGSSGTAFAAAPSPYDKQTTGFKIAHTAEASDYEIGFSVFGTLA